MVDQTNRIQTRCCIAGGGPAGMVLGYLLARVGVPVVVLEKHGDFLRDFRGDTVHPSTLEVIYELGLLPAFLKRPHQEIRELSGIVNGEQVTIADLSHLPTRCKFIALMPQWDFLDFLVEQARKFPEFSLRMETRAVGLLENGGRVTGVVCQGKDGPFEILADLVVAADGRHSDLRQAAALDVIDYGSPIDVLWMRISRRPGDPEATAGRFADGHILVMINRHDYWQCAFVVPKGGSEAVCAAGLPAFHAQILALAPFLRDRVEELGSWEKVKVLTVTVNRLRQWAKPGLQFIGDAAHAMSPVGGVGINLAVQDAVAAANLLHQPLLNGPPTLAQLEEVQKRREWPTQMTQRVQIFMHNNILSPALASRTSQKGEHHGLPLVLRIARRFPFLRRIPARTFAMGFRPEHVSPEILNKRQAQWA